jgi:hypothetical protein
MMFPDSVRDRVLEEAIADGDGLSSRATSRTPMAPVYGLLSPNRTVIDWRTKRRLEGINLVSTAPAY